ncbi:MAG TPA: GMC family oxidoreductase N-terminal domain-containing protein [Bryobacteraceae bacterium]|nr:GMC family oxidoreductase N-terminal domain-containing protein [Bryobacteraceae bacterium]
MLFDFLIVGAGSAGCVLAARLSEDPSARVLLLEAGERDTRKEIHIPAAFPRIFKSSADWAYQTEPQPRLNGRRLFWPRGKVIGGCSSINAMIYIRGQRQDFDSWRDAGNPGWSFEDVLPLFRAMESRTGGPLHVTDLRAPHRLSRAYLEACAECGIPLNPDFNGDTQEGAGLYQVTQKGGRRHSAAAAYLKPALRRPNLTVATGAHATRVLFEGRRAVGVEYVKNGRLEQARAGEVVLCGGAVNTPQLLMLSGIGPRDHLQTIGVPVLEDLPGVGANLQDHLAMIICDRCTQPVTLDHAGSARDFLSWLFLKTGPLTSNIAEGGAFVRSRPGYKEPNLQFLFGPVFFIQHGFVKPSGHGFSLGPVLLHPRSRGTIRLRSHDPFDPPLIQPNYLEDPEDLAQLIDGVRLARRILAAHAFDAFRKDEFLPGASAESDEEVAAAIANMAETLYHPVGTCRMGTGGGAVVDSALRVHGLRQLRVADASIMPTVTGGNTNAPAILIGEKASRMIRGEERVTAGSSVYSVPTSRG